jgi:ornithine cyclodeaminase
MVQFVSVQNMMALIRDKGIEAIIMQIANRIESDFKRWPEFDKQPRIPAHSDDGVIELMPTDDGVTYGFKYVNGHPLNYKLGKQTVTGFGVLADMETGYPQFLSEMTILTALRTAATSALVAKYLARDDSKAMAMIGTGCQAEFQAYAFKAMLGITDIRIFDIDPEAMDKFEHNMQDSGLAITRCADTHDAVKRADIITTCTADKAQAKILTENMVGQGMHINAIGGDCPGKTELEKSILMKSDIFVEYPDQTWVEGEIQQLESNHPITELWQVMVGDADGRVNDTQITVFDSVGFAIEDFSALSTIMDMTKGTDYAEDIDLLALPDNPKDLFGMTDHSSNI